MKPVESFFCGILLIAILAVIVGQRSQTANVIQAAASALSNILAVVVAPVTGSRVQSSAATGGANLLANNPFASMSRG